jgi:hypothetical protein
MPSLYVRLLELYVAGEGAEGRKRETGLSATLKDSIRSWRGLRRGSEGRRARVRGFGGRLEAGTASPHQF